RVRLSGTEPRSRPGGPPTRGPAPFFFFQWSGDHRDLHSFPTRRSSDLSCRRENKPVRLHCNRHPSWHDQYKTLPLSTRDGWTLRSEEHTSELQSPYDLVCRLLLEKKKKKTHNGTSNSAPACANAISPV